MEKQVDLSVIIPAYQEWERFFLTVDFLMFSLNFVNIDSQVIIVCVYGDDLTIQSARRAAIAAENRVLVVLTHKLGFGEAVRKGLKYVKGRWVGLYMADGSDCPEDLIKMFRCAGEGRDAVFGNRYVIQNSMKGYPRLKWFLNRTGNRLISWSLGKWNWDMTGSMKLYRFEALKNLFPLQSTGFSISLEMAMKAVKAGFFIVQIPVGWTGRKSGRSKFRLWPETWEYIKTAIREGV